MNEQPNEHLGTSESLERDEAAIGERRTSAISNNIMQGSGGIIAAVVACFLFLLICVHFAILANPNQSRMANFAQVMLPTSMWNCVQRMVVNRALSVLGFFLDRFLPVVICCMVVFGCWSVIFVHVHPWIDQQDHASKTHKWVGHMLFGACVASWRLAPRTPDYCHRQESGTVQSFSMQSVHVC